MTSPANQKAFWLFVACCIAALIGLVCMVSITDAARYQITTDITWVAPDGPSNPFPDIEHCFKVGDRFTYEVVYEGMTTDGVDVRSGDYALYNGTPSNPGDAVDNLYWFGRPAGPIPPENTNSEGYFTFRHDAGQFAHTFNVGLRDGMASHIAGDAGPCQATFRADWRALIPGDANRDWVFNSADLIQVFQAGTFGQPGAVWATGDWNDDGFFTTDDLVLAFQADAYQPNAVAVPEPRIKTLALMIVCCVAVWWMMSR